MYLGIFQIPFCERNNICKFSSKYLKIKLVRYYETKTKKKYDPKIETFKYLVLFDQRDQNKSWLVFNNDSKVCKFPGLVSSHSIFIAIFLKLHKTKVQKQNYCYLKFEQNCFYICGGDTGPLKSIAIVFNLTLCTFDIKILYNMIV